MSGADWAGLVSVMRSVEYGPVVAMVAILVLGDIMYILISSVRNSFRVV